jgi:peptide chain release factor 3
MNKKYHQSPPLPAECSLELLSFSVARWVKGGWAALDQVGRLFNTLAVKDQWERPVLLFKNQWNLEQVMADHPNLELSPIALPSNSEAG